MTPEMAVRIGQEALQMAALVAAVPLLSALVVGLLVGMLQAATQINEMTLSFIPKLLVLAAALSIGGPWMLATLIDYTQRVFRSIPMVIG